MTQAAILRVSIVMLAAAGFNNVSFPEGRDAFSLSTGALPLLSLAMTHPFNLSMQLLAQEESMQHSSS